MRTWSVKDAKARFSEFLDACLLEGPQMVTRRNGEAAVLVPVQEWRRLQSVARPSLKQLLLADQARNDMIMPARGRAKRLHCESTEELGFVKAVAQGLADIHEGSTVTLSEARKVLGMA